MSTNSVRPGVTGAVAVAAGHRLPEDRWHAAEIAFWLIPIAAFDLAR